MRRPTTRHLMKERIKQTLYNTRLLKRKNTDCAILRLPVELLIEISEYLPPHARIILSMTCRPLFHSLNHLQDWASGLDREEKINYLACRVRDLPDHWLCRQRVRIRPVVENDRPQGQEPLFRLMGGVGFGTFGLHHHHVQTTLKYVRLGPARTKRQEQHLAQLMEPYDYIQPLKAIPISVVKDDSPSPSIRYHVCPIVIEDRYLTFSTWSYDRVLEGTWYNGKGRADICQHQWTPPCLFSKDESRLSEPVQSAQPALHRLEETVAAAFADRDVEKQGSCPFCPTDFSVMVSPARQPSVELQAWVDMGTETVATDVAWMEHPNQDMSVVTRSQLGLYHEEGSVRRSYELAEAGKKRSTQGETDDGGCEKKRTGASSSHRTLLWQRLCKYVA